MINRLDLGQYLKETEEIRDIKERNRKAEGILMQIFLKNCAKQCPQDKCGMYFQLMKDTECTHVQCPRCNHYFCWSCNSVAKGQKHFKEKPQCRELAGVFQPEEVTQELREKHIGSHEDYINIKFCVQCPGCKSINEKKTKVNALNCKDCGMLFCYICNKPISGMEHYTHAKTICNYESEHWSDL